MPRMLFSALLKPFKGRVRGAIAELPEIEAESADFHGVVESLQSQIRKRLGDLNPKQNCSGVPIGPTPKREAEDEIVHPMEADVPERKDGV